MSRLIVFDTMGVINRAYHAFPKWTRLGDRKPVGAIGGFWQIIYRTLKTHIAAKGDDLIAFACDAPGRTFRHDLCQTYKANRSAKETDLVAQYADIMESIKVSGAEIISSDGYEADDIMATLAWRRHQKGQQTIIVSADKDMMQCMPYAILFGWVFEERVNDHGNPYKLYVQRQITDADCRAKFGCSPEHVATALALMGDASDGYSGVPGVGPKGAARLIEAFGGLDEILQAAETMDNARMKAALTEHADVARLALRLATVDTDVPGIPGIWSSVDDIDWGAVGALLRRFGLVSAPEEIERGIE
jgi:DNA polymerase-1